MTTSSTARPRSSPTQAELPAGVEEVNDEGETVNPGAAEETAPPDAQLAFPPHDSSDTMTRRSAIIVVALVVAALIGVGLMVVPSSPLHQKPTLGLDLQGGLEITKQAVPPKGREPDEGGSRPLGLDHARPRRPPRRLRAGDPHAGRRPDHDPAARRQGSGDRREDHRQDRPARALRPRGEPGAAVDRRAPAAGREEVGLRAARGPAGARRQGDARAVLALQQAEEARRRARLDEDGGARQVQRQGARGLQALRYRREPWSSPAASARSSAPVSSRRTRRRTRTTCSSTRRRPCPR